MYFNNSINVDCKQNLKQGAGADGPNGEMDQTRVFLSQKP
jgi:hypothetical protein